MIEFKYKDKIYTTPNLDKKLKRLRISREDIEIIKITSDEEKKPEIKDEYPDWLYCYFFNPDNKHSHIVISKDHVKPTKDILYKDIFNNNLGIKEFTKEYIDKLILLDGEPVFPIIIDNSTNLPILKYKYIWKQ